MPNEGAQRFGPTGPEMFQGGQWASVFPSGGAFPVGGRPTAELEGPGLGPLLSTATSAYTTPARTIAAAILPEPGKGRVRSAIEEFQRPAQERQGLEQLLEERGVGEGPGIQTPLGRLTTRGALSLVGEDLPFLAAGPAVRGARGLARGTRTAVQALLPEETFLHGTTRSFQRIAPQGTEPIYLTKVPEVARQYAMPVQEGQRSRVLRFNIKPEAKVLDLRKLPEAEALGVVNERMRGRPLLQMMQEEGIDVLHATKNETLVANLDVLRGSRTALEKLENLLPEGLQFQARRATGRLPARVAGAAGDRVTWARQQAADARHALERLSAVRRGDDFFSEAEAREIGFFARMDAPPPVGRGPVDWGGIETGVKSFIKEQEDIVRQAGESAKLTRTPPRALAAEAIPSRQLPLPGFEGGVSPPAAPRMAININLERLGTSDDVRGLIRQTARENEGLIQAQRRGTISQQETQELADMVGMTPEKLAKLPKGKALNAEELLASRQILLTKSDEVIAAQRAFQELDSSENLLRFHQLLNEHIALQSSVSGATAEAGRALSQQRIIARARQTPNLIDDVVKRLGGKEVGSELAHKLAQIDPNDPVALSRLIRSLEKYTFPEKVQSYWIANILSGPRTQMRNIISNSIFGTLQPFQRAVRGAADIPVSALQRRPREFYTSEALPSAMAYFRGFPHGMRKAVSIMRNGFDVEDAAKLDFARRYDFPGNLKNPWNWPGRLLVGMDAMFKSMAFESELAALAVRKVSKEGLKGRPRADRIADVLHAPSSEMVDSAQRFSKMTTFTDDPSDLVQRALSLRNWQPIPKGLPGASLQPLRFVVPFINTPANLLKRGLQYSPVGVAQLPFTKGAQVSEVLTRNIIGSLILATGATLYADGKLTGAPPRDRAARDTFYRSGKQPYSVLIGDRWISYQQAAPLNLPLVLVAAFGDAFRDNAEEPVPEKVMLAASAVGHSFLDMSFFSGLDDLLSAIEDPAQYGERFIQNVASGFSPLSGLQRNIAQAFDPLIRDPEGILEKLEAQSPALSQEVPARLNAFGQEIERRGGSGFMAFMPSAAPENRADAVTTELARLGVDVGFVGTTLTFTGERVRLTRDQEREYQIVVGQAIWEALVREMGRSSYESESDERKIEAVESTVDTARRKARDAFKVRMAREDPELELAPSGGVNPLFEAFGQAAPRNPLFGAFGGGGANPLFEAFGR